MKRPEDVIQRAIVDHLRAVLPQCVVIHIPNKPRSAIAGAREKALGAVAGVPDLLVMLPKGQGLWIEVKAPGGTVQKNQLDFAHRCLALGWPRFVARSIDDVRGALSALQIPTRETRATP